MPETEEKPEDDETPEAVDDPVVEFLTLERNDRLWLRAIVPLLQLHADGTEAEDCPRVQLAWRWMKVAACERVARIMRSDLPDENEDQA